ncbi:hypothetical protein EW146_g2848, partial [Bondarzewia mesenterica]
PPYDPLLPPGGEDNLTLADIPQLVEAAQAIEQHRSLPGQNSIPYIAELTPLELTIVKHCAVLVLARSPLRDQFDLDEILEMVELKKQGFWNKLFKGNDKKNVKKKGVFGVPLELLAEREGADSMHGASRATLKVPSFIDDVVSAMRQMDMSVEGIFRKNGNIRRLKDLTEAIDRDPSSVDLTQDNPVQLAALLKKFLRDLPDPLMTFKLHRIFIASQGASLGFPQFGSIVEMLIAATFDAGLPNDADRQRLLHMISLILPKSHRDTMEVLFVFLKWVASFAHMDERTGSKMDLPNLATVICPSILYSQGSNAVRDDSFGAIRVITALLENQDEYYTVPEEFLAILHDQEYFAHSMDLPSKEFMKKCDTYMRLKASGRTPPAPAMSPVGNTSPFQSNNSYLPRPIDGLESRLGPSLSRSPPERPTLSSSQPDILLRNGYSSNARQQSPQPTLSHSPVSFSAAGQIPASLSQGVAMMQQQQQLQQPQPQLPQQQQLDVEWANAQRPPQPPMVASNSRPMSASFPRTSGEHSFTPPNGHTTPVQLRQRT